MPSTNFEERATECIKLAEATENFRDREFYLMLASAWRGLAESEDDDLWRNQKRFTSLRIVCADGAAVSSRAHPCAIGQR